MSHGQTAVRKVLLLEAGASGPRDRFDPGFAAAPRSAERQRSSAPCGDFSFDQLPGTGCHLGRLFADVAARSREAAAIRTSVANWSYARLLAGATAIAQRLKNEASFLCGDRVILIAPNSAEYAAGFYGVLLAGGVVVPVPPRTESGSLNAIFEMTDARLLLATSEVVRSRKDPWILRQEPLSLDAAESSEPPVAAIADETTGDELAAVFFTGGSTGTPKGVMLSHRNLISNAQAIQGYLSIGPSDRPLCVLPFHHAFGNSVLQSHLLAGAELVLDGNTSFPETIVQALVQHECTSLSGVPDLFRLLLDRTSLGKTRLPALRSMAVAGGALRRELALEVARRIRPAEFYVMYGQTEATARLAYVPPERLADDLAEGCIGRGVPGVTLWVVNEQDRTVAPGEVGELRARGPNVMLGYWRDPAATAERFCDGWLRTGDLATIDDSGMICLKGRANSFVKIAGFRVNLGELEDFICRRLAARHAVAVAFESADVGTRLAVYVKSDATRNKLDVATIIASCRAELPRHLVPAFAELVDEFPLNHAMKIDRLALTQRAEHHSARQRTVASRIIPRIGFGLIPANR
jgi:acyl-CoA synthetase (AMP-forming)/AMP-acid ligase II